MKQTQNVDSRVEMWLAGVYVCVAQVQQTQGLKRLVVTSGGITCANLREPT